MHGGPALSAQRQQLGAGGTRDAALQDRGPGALARPPESQTQLVSTRTARRRRSRTEDPGTTRTTFRVHSRSEADQWAAAALPALGTTGCMGCVVRHQPAAEPGGSGCTPQEHSHTTCPLCPASPDMTAPGKGCPEPATWSRTAPTQSLNSLSTHSHLPPRGTGRCVLCSASPWQSARIQSSPPLGREWVLKSQPPASLPFPGPAAHRPGLLPPALAACAPRSVLPASLPSTRQADIGCPTGAESVTRIS